MNFRHLLAGAALATGISGAAQAATLTTDFATWAANAGSYTNTSSTGLGEYATTTSVTLADGHTLSADQTLTVLNPFDGYGPWSGGYSGDVLDTTTSTVTLTLDNQVTALGLTLSPDVFLVSPISVTYTATLADGTTLSATDVVQYSSDTQFVGFYGGPVGTLTLSIVGNYSVLEQNGANNPYLTGAVSDFAFGNIDSVPEPASFALIGTALAGLGLVRRHARG